MATLAVIIGGVIANAVAFTAGNAIYHAVDSNGAGEEKERHDKALEAETKARDEWNKKRTKTLDYLNRRRQRERESEYAFEDTDQALKLYDGVTHKSSPTLGKKPTLNDFYQPSEEQKYYEYVFITGSVAVSGLMANKFL